MNKILSILILALAWTACGQPAPINRRAMVISGLAASVAGPDTIAGLRFRWVASDIPANGSPSNWVDRVSGYHLVQNTAGNRSTNSAVNGVFFNPNHPDFLNATNWTWGSGDAFFIIYRQEYLSETGSDDLPWFSNSAGTSFVGINHSTTPRDQAWTFNQFVTLSNKTLKTNVMQCFLENSKTTGANYTNGVTAQSTSVIDGFTVDWVGKTLANGGTTREYGGYIYEICVWTNHLMTAGDVTTLYTYAKQFGVP